MDPWLTSKLYLSHSQVQTPIISFIARLKGALAQIGLTPITKAAKDFSEHLQEDISARGEHFERVLS